VEAGEEGSRDGDGDGAARARAERAKTRAARNAVKGGRAAPPAMMPAVFDDAMSMSFDEDEDEDEVDEETTRAVIEATMLRLRSRQALGKPLMTKKPTPVATTPNAKAAKKTGRKTAKKMDWQSFVDWKTLEHQEYETLSDAQFNKLSKKLALEPHWRPMVTYLTSIGLKVADLERVVVNCSELFNRPVSRVISRVEYLQSELGLEKKNLRQIVNKDPRILLQRNRHSIPRCRYLTKIGVPQEKLADILGKQPSILHLSVQKGLMARVQYFKDVGVAAEDIPLLIQRSPAILTFSIENQIQPRLEFLRDLGISDENVVKMLTRHPQMLHYSFDNLEEKLNFLGDIGMNDSEAALTVTRLSQFFSLSVEDSLRPKYKYLTDKLGGTKDTCVKYPAYFSLSLDQRIRPRHTFLEQYDLAPDPFPMKLLSVKDEDFVSRASKSIGEFEAYKDEMVPIFAAQSAREKTLREVSTSAENQRLMLERKRLEFIRNNRADTIRKRDYNDRVAKARQSLRLLKNRSQHRSR
tara:strand:- start:3690 stop:5258 length:1569 start_codon:yes stop_codon:yes gene_type:complete